MTPFPNIPAKAYVRSCEICIKLIPLSDVGHGCVTCFLDGRLTLFCSRACRLEHDKRHHQKAPPRSKYTEPDRPGHKLWCSGHCGGRCGGAS